jgi:hypothetical protein
LSFFDDEDEPLTEQRTAPRGGRGSSGGRRPPSGGRRSASEQQAFMARRAIALTGIVIVVILIVLGVHSCEVSQRNSALKDYSNSVATLTAKSNQTGHALFNGLSGASAASNATNLQTQVNQLLQDTRSQLNQAKALDVPNEMRVAQQDLLLTLQMRRDGVSNIAGQIQQALSKSTSGDAAKSIAAEMARLYGSDVVYTDYSAPAIVSALHSAGIFGQPIASGQFVTDIQWLQPSFVASKFGAALPTTQNGKPAPGIHGHAMQSCSVNGTALVVGATNTLPANPPPTFSCAFSNDGQNNETNVVVKVQVSGTSISGQAIVPQTMPGHQYTAQAQLNSAPPAGSYTVTATVEKVPGETVTTHNTQSFPVTFH